MIRLTGRGIAVLAGAVVLFVAGQLLGYQVLLIVAAAGVGAVLAAAGVTVRRPRIRVSRMVYPERVERGEPAFANLLVRNEGGRRQAAFSAGDRVGGGFYAVTVRALPAGAEATYAYELPTSDRGRQRVGPLTMERGDPLGLFASRLTTGDTTTLWVYPRLLPVRMRAGGHPRHHHEGATTDDSLRGSVDLREVRPYVPGDEVRHLHWKATARTGQLMVRDYIDPNQPRFTTVLDSRAADQFEDAIDLAASLTSAAARAEHRCRLLTPCGVDLATTGGSLAVRTLLDALCVLTPASATNLPLLPVNLTDTGGRLVVISTAPTAADRAAIASVRQQYAGTTVVALGTTPADAPRIPGATVLSARDAEDAVRRWNGVG